jgi:glycosyltransferase involved in cell wall biosynthesis
MHTLPVGSNIVRSGLSHNEARERLGIDPGVVVIGVFGAAHKSRLLSWISEAARALQNAGEEILVLYVGPDGPAMQSACEGLRLRNCGPLPASDAGDFLKAADVMLAPFVDGLSTRRGSVMAALQHGIPVASTRTAYTDSIFDEFDEQAMLLAPVSDAFTFGRDVLQWWQRRREMGFGPDAGPRAGKLFVENFSWPAIARRFLRILGDENIGRKPIEVPVSSNVSL